MTYEEIYTSYRKRVLAYLADRTGSPEHAEDLCEDVFEQIGFEDPEEDEELVNTRMGEWAYEQFTAIPRPGDSFRYHGLEITVSAMDHNRIRKLNVALLPPEAEGGEDA